MATINKVSLIFLLVTAISAAAARPNSRNDTDVHVTRDLSQQQPQRLRRRNLWRPQTRIVGGKDAAEGKFPFFVEISNGCGGTLIHHDLVLTAAHCVDGTKNAAMLRNVPTVFIGGVSSQKGLQRRIVDMRIDPRYDKSTKSYDFALLLLDKPVTTIEPALLNYAPTYPKEGVPLAVAGYGRTQASVQGQSPNLQHAEVNARSDCSSSIYPAGKVKGYEMFCANSLDYSQDACQGDSGGPLIDLNKNVLVGIVSWGSGCASYNAPGVYARISAAVEWLELEKCQFSSVPSSECICTRHDSHCQEIQVNIAYDAYPAETGFRLARQSDGAVLLSSPEGSNTGSPLTTISYSLLVPPGSYKVAIVDTYGDGICCNYGAGSVSVNIGPDTIHHNGVFSDRDTLAFDVTSKNTESEKMETIPVKEITPTVAPTSLSPTPSPRATLQVSIAYDDYPQEVSWEVLDALTGDSLHRSPSYSVMTPRAVVTTGISDLIVGRAYQFIVADIAHDGLCWDNYCGSVELSVKGSDDILWSHPGNYGSSLEGTVVL